LGLFPARFSQRAVEAGRAAGVAGDAALLLHGEEDRIAVAVEPHFPHALHESRLLALGPEAPARARPVHGALLAHGAKERLAVHPRHGEHAPRRVLRHCRHETVGVEAHLVEPRRFGGRGHRRTSMPWRAMSSFASLPVCSPKWKMRAATTASAPPSSTPSTRCSR